MPNFPAPVGMVPMPNAMPGPAPVPVSAPASMPGSQRPSIWDMIQGKFMDTVKSPDFFDRLAVGASGMTLRGQTPASMAARQRMLSRQAQQERQELLKQEAAQYARYLVDNGVLTEEQVAQYANAPRLLESITAEHLKSRGSLGLTAATRAKVEQAQILGLEPGSPEFKAFMGGSSTIGGLNKESLDGITALRKDFMSLPTTKAFQEQTQAYNRILSAAEEPSAAGDLALIFSYMKVLDPGSTVREGEFASAQNAAGVPERVRALYANVMRGERLTPEQRKDFVGRSGKLYNSAKTIYDDQLEDYKKLANPYLEGTDRKADEFFPSLYIPEPPKAPVAADIPEYITNPVGAMYSPYSKSDLMAEARRRGLVPQ